MEILAAASNWLQNVHQATNSRLVTYVPAGGVAIPGLNARIGKTEFPLELEDGLVETWEARDFLIQVLDLGSTVPRSGDTIVETVAGVNYTYELTAPKGQQVAPFDDRYRQVYRIHTKAVS